MPVLTSMWPPPAHGHGHHASSRSPATSTPRRPRPDDEVVVVTETRDGRLATDLLDQSRRPATDRLAASKEGERSPGPYELLLMSFGARTAMAVRLHAQRKGWPLGRVSVRVRRARMRTKKCASRGRPAAKLDQIERLVDLPGPLDPAQRERLMRIADACPFDPTLARSTEILRTLPARHGED